MRSTLILIVTSLIIVKINGKNEATTTETTKTTTTTVPIAVSFPSGTDDGPNATVSQIIQLTHSPLEVEINQTEEWSFTKRPFGMPIVFTGDCFPYTGRTMDSVMDRYPAVAENVHLIADGRWVSNVCVGKILPEYQSPSCYNGTNICSGRGVCKMMNEGHLRIEFFYCNCDWGFKGLFCEKEIHRNVYIIYILCGVVVFEGICLMYGGIYIARHRRVFTAPERQRKRFVDVLNNK